MRAITVTPGVADSVRLEEVPEPPVSEGPVLVELVGVGVCGTDREIIAGAYGKAPPGEERLVLGHESVGRVLEAPNDCGLRPGDWVAGVVRRPDPVPCPNCAVGDWDMCLNGRYTEHGIKGLHGFMSERVRLEVGEAVKLPSRLGVAGVLLEPASVLAKAWDQLDHFSRRSRAVLRNVVVVGAGTIGLMAALMAVQRGMRVQVLDRVTSGPKPALVEALGAKYETGSLAELCPRADIIVECTGVGTLVIEVMKRVAPTGIVCLAGISSSQKALRVEAAALGRELVLENNVVFGTVNANRSHYDRAVEALVRADPEWLSRILTRSVPLGSWREAFTAEPDDVKTVLRFGE